VIFSIGKNSIVLFYKVLCKQNFLECMCWTTWTSARWRTIRNFKFVQRFEEPEVLIRGTTCTLYLIVDSFYPIRTYLQKNRNKNQCTITFYHPKISSEIIWYDNKPNQIHYLSHWTYVFINHCFNKSYVTHIDIFSTKHLKPKIIRVEYYVIHKSLFLLLYGNIEPNPGLIPQLLTNFPTYHKHRNKIYFCPGSLKLCLEYKLLAII
jgi:hypothetical protein